MSWWPSTRLCKWASIMPINLFLCLLFHLFIMPINSFIYYANYFIYLLCLLIHLFIMTINSFIDYDY